MIGFRILRSLVPRPRTPVRFRHCVPLVVFLVLFAGTCVALEWSETLLFSRPSAFGLTIFTVWMWWMYLAGAGGLGRWRAVAALMVRLTLAGLFIMLLAEPRAVRIRDVLSVVYALDISDSIGEESVDKGLRFVAETVSQKPQKDEAGLVVFGRDSAVELPPRKTVPLESDGVINSLIDRDATNLGQSLSLAAAMVPQENQGRIVLISDGTQTAGSLRPVLEELRSHNVAVDVLPIEYHYDREVWLERLELPRFVKLGENYEASVVLNSLQAGTGRLVLRENGEIIFREEVDFDAGKNRYTVPIAVGEAGYYEYSAAIETAREDDHLRRNNRVLNYLYVEGEGKVLLVTDPNGDPRDWQTLAETIRDGERSVEVRSAYEFPRDSLSLLPYDAIAFVNVPASAFDTVQFQALHDGVYDMGIGFLMVGGENSFGPGGYHNTLAEKALPVEMDVSQRKVLLNGALVLVLDHSGSMNGPVQGIQGTKQAAANNAAVAAIRTLEAEDWLGVVTFDSRATWTVPFARNAAPGQAAQRVRTIGSGGGTNMYPALAEAAAALEGLDEGKAAVKHIILLTDGRSTAGDAAGFIQRCQANRISVSTIGVGRRGGVNAPLLQGIAHATGGRFYAVTDASRLPKVFIHEAVTLRRTAIRNEPFTPRAVSFSPILKGIDAFPPLKGMVLTTPKGRAETVLVAPATEKAAQQDPVLAFWRYGVGAAAAFTSDLSPNWGADWVQWDRYQPFIKQLLTKISRVREEGHLRMWTYTSGNRGVIVAEDFHPEEQFLDVRAVVSGPRNREKTVRLKQVAPRRYQATVPLWGKGRYQVKAVGKAGERSDRAHGGLIVPYSPEYLRFRSNPITLKRIAEESGGQMLDQDTTAKTIYETRRRPQQSSRPIFDWFLIALACLVPLDVAVRRIQIDRRLLRRWLSFGRRAGPSTATMGTLLQRKQTVASQLQGTRTTQREADHSGPMRSPGESQREQPPPPKTPPEQPRKQESEEEKSTTERLLDLKRRRRKEGVE